MLIASQPSQTSAETFPPAQLITALMHPDGYLAPRPLVPSRGMAWRMAIVNRNWNSCSEIRIYTPPASPVEKSRSQPVGLLPGTVISPISAFSLLLPSLPPTAPADRGFYGISSGCSCHSFYSWSVKVEKVIYDISRGQWRLDICRAAHHQISIMKDTRYFAP